MARLAARPTVEAARVPSAIEWLESAGLLWDRMTPRQVKLYLMEHDGLSATEAEAYVEALRDTEAGSLMLWIDRRRFS